MAGVTVAPSTTPAHPRILFTTRVQSPLFVREVQIGGRNHVQTVLRTTKRYLARPAPDAIRHEENGVTWYERNGTVPEERILAQRRALSLRLNPPRPPQRLRLTMPRPRRLRLTMPRPRRLHLTGPRHPDPQIAALQSAVARMDLDSRRNFLLSHDAPQMPTAIPQFVPRIILRVGDDAQTPSSGTNTQTLGCGVNAHETTLRLRGGALVG